jgi:hypothetical protein
MLSDYTEVIALHTNALSNDTDDDHLGDYDEAMVYHTDPLKADTDADGLSDFQEIMTYGTNPIEKDTDRDMLSDYAEVAWHTNPLINDTDADALSDGQEALVYHTDPLSWDSDGDTLSDYQEIFIYHTNPLIPDTDGDGLPDNVDFDPHMHWAYPVLGIGLAVSVGGIAIRRYRKMHGEAAPLTAAEPTSPGLEPGMDVLVEYKIREGKVVFGVAVRNDSTTPMQNAQVVLAIPDLTEIIKSQSMGTIESGFGSIAEIEFELEPGAQGELVGLMEYDTASGEHRVVNLKPVKIVA